MTDLQRYAGADWGFVHDSSALAIVEADEELIRVVCLAEWRANAGDDHETRLGKRDPRVIVPEAAALCRKHKAELVMSDRVENAYVVHELDDNGIGWEGAPVKPEDIFQSYYKLSMLLRFGKVDLSGSNVRHHAKRLKQQMLRVKRKATGAGGDKIELSSADGSHSDLLSALVLAVWQAPTVAQDGTILRLKSRTAGHDHRFLESEGKYFENSQEFEEDNDGEPGPAEPLIAVG